MHGMLPALGAPVQECCVSKTQDAELWPERPLDFPDRATRTPPHHGLSRLVLGLRTSKSMNHLLKARCHKVGGKCLNTAWVSRRPGLSSSLHRMPDEGAGTRCNQLDFLEAREELQMLYKRYRRAAHNANSPHDLKLLIHLKFVCRLHS